MVSSFTPGTFEYFSMLALAALMGPGIIGLSLGLAIAEEFFDSDDEERINQVALPLYVSFALFVLISAALFVLYKILTYVE